MAELVRCDRCGEETSKGNSSSIHEEAQRIDTCQVCREEWDTYTQAAYASYEAIRAHLYEIWMKGASKQEVMRQVGARFRTQKADPVARLATMRGREAR